jgi:(p)ppGpp synthase/HD superfamily hydrolase
MATIERAVQIAAEAHLGQKDKAGAPYLLHPLRLMMRMQSEPAMIAAVLHDVVEDTDLSLEDLRVEGFSEEVLLAVECLTRRDDESYDEFIERVKTSEIALQVKIADLEDNMNLNRLAEVTQKDLARLEKYHRVWCSLTK